jgi:hypothetical protein
MGLALVGRTSRSAADLLVSLRPTHEHENPLSPLMDLRPINDNENRIGAGSVSDLVGPFFPSARQSGFQGGGNDISPEPQIVYATSTPAHL